MPLKLASSSRNAAVRVARRTRLASFSLFSVSRRCSANSSSRSVALTACKCATSHLLCSAVWGMGCFCLILDRTHREDQVQVTRHDTAGTFAARTSEAAKNATVRASRRE